MFNDSDWVGIRAALIMLPIGAAAGVAALLRKKAVNSELVFDKTDIAGAMLNSSLFASGFCLLMFAYNGPDKALFNIGMSVFAGLGGNTALGAVLLIWKNIVKTSVGVGGTDDDKD